MRLRQIEERDLPQLRDWRNCDAIRHRCREYRLLNMVNQREWFQHISTSRDVEMFAIERDGSLIGVCGLCHISWVNRTAEVSLYIGPKELRGKGFGRQILQMLEAKAFEEFNLHRLWAEVFVFVFSVPDTLEDAGFVSNIFEDAGYKREGTLKEHIFARGQYWDSYRYGKVVKE